MIISPLKILKYPHAGLRKVALEVMAFDDDLKNTVEQMFEVMYEVEGWGLAATQVGLMHRLFVMDLSFGEGQGMCFINPHITSKNEEETKEEDCLSFPGLYLTIPRAYEIEMSYQDERGEAKSMTLKGLAARCAQHEMDHLNGVLFIDYLSQLKRDRILKKYEKIGPHNACGTGCGHHH